MEALPRLSTRGRRRLIGDHGPTRLSDVPAQGGRSAGRRFAACDTSRGIEPSYSLRAGSSHAEPGSKALSISKTRTSNGSLSSSGVTSCRFRKWGVCLWCSTASASS